MASSSLIVRKQFEFKEKYHICNLIVLADTKTNCKKYDTVQKSDQNVSENNIAYKQINIGHVKLDGTIYIDNLSVSLSFLYNVVRKTSGCNGVNSLLQYNYFLNNGESFELRFYIIALKT